MVFLVGRDGLLGGCAAVLEDALAGRGRVLLLAGEAGIGKTSVAHALVDLAREAGALVRWGACWESEGLPPYAPWLQALEQPGHDACAAAAAMLGGDDAHADSSDPGAAERIRLRHVTQVAAAIRADGAERPQVIVLEDLHWADHPSLRLLHALAAQVPALPVLVIGTYRDDELAADSPLGSLGGNAERVRIGGLDHDAVAALLASVTGVEASLAEVHAVRDQTAGNPLFVTQMARLQVAGSRSLPAGASDLLGRRLARLSDRCHSALGAAAVLGPELRTGVLGEVLGLDDVEVLAALDEAEAARIIGRVDGDPDRWAFVHALFRAARYDQLGSSERATLHRQACDALAGTPGVAAATVAHHALRARFDADDPTPARHALAAGHEALAGFALDDARTLFDRAAAVAPPGGDGEELRAKASLGLGTALLRGGAGAGAGKAFEAAAAIARAMGRADLLAEAALSFGAGFGGFEVRLMDQRQIDLLEEAAAVLPSDAALRPWVLARLSVATSFLGMDRRRLELADEALRLARERGDPAAVGTALASRCDAMAGPADVAERLGASAEIVAIGQRIGDLPLELLGRRLRVVALAELCDVDALDDEIYAFERTAARLGDPLYSWYVALWRGMRALTAGRFDEVVKRAEEVAETGALAGSDNAAVLSKVLLLTMSMMTRSSGQLEDEAMELVESHPELMGPSSVPMVVHIELQRGASPADVVPRLLGLFERLPVDAEWLPAAATVVEDAFTCASVELAADAYRRLAPFSGLGVIEGIGAGHRGALDTYLALAAAVLGDREATVTHIDIALGISVRLGVFVRAHALDTAARALWVLAVPELDDRATALAAEAAEIYASLGLTELAGLASTTSAAAHAGSSLVREGDTWAITHRGSTTRLRHAKGIADLAVLLSRPGTAVHVRDLEGVAELPRGPQTEAALDQTAVAQYRQRLRDIEDDLDEADRHGDVGRAELLAAERDALVDELTKAFGLGGRARPAAGDPDERLRKAVSARVKMAIDRIGDVDEALGRHLRNAVKTGFWCSYEPEQPVAWRVSEQR